MGIHKGKTFHSDSYTAIVTSIAEYLPELPDYCLSCVVLSPLRLLHSLFGKEDLCIPPLSATSIKALQILPKFMLHYLLAPSRSTELDDNTKR